MTPIHLTHPGDPTSDVLPSADPLWTELLMTAPTPDPQRLISRNSRELKIIRCGELSEKWVHTPFVTDISSFWPKGPPARADTLMSITPSMTKKYGKELSGQISQMIKMDPATCSNPQNVYATDITGTYSLLSASKTHPSDFTQSISIDPI